VETQQPVGKSWITDAIIIALVTAFAYLSAVYYEIGFCDYFNIPHYLISLNSRWREIKYQYIGALGSVAAIKNVRSKRLSWEF